MKTLDITCGIYDTEYSLTEHKDGSVTVRAPYIKWVQNSGNLAFRLSKVVGKKAELIKQIFATQNRHLEINGNWIMLEDLI